jgi:hypothetical protein
VRLWFSGSTRFDSRYRRERAPYERPAHTGRNPSRRRFPRRLGPAIGLRGRGIPEIGSTAKIAFAAVRLAHLNLGATAARVCDGCRCWCSSASGNRIEVRGVTFSSF